MNHITTSHRSKAQRPKKVTFDEPNPKNGHISLSSSSSSCSDSSPTISSHSPFSIDMDSQIHRSSNSISLNFTNYSAADDSLDSNVSISIDSLSRSKSITKTMPSPITPSSSPFPRPIAIQYKSGIPLSCRSTLCNAVLSYKSPRSNRSVLICMVLSAKSNRNKVFQHEQIRDLWKPLRRSRRMNGSSGFDILYPEHPEGVVIDSDRELLYLLDQGMAYDLRTRTWDYNCILPAFTQWETSGSSTLYIGDGINEFHGVYHDRKDYGLRHLVTSSRFRDDDDNALSTDCHIDPKFRFTGLQIVYCRWLQQLTVFGGRQTKREKRKEKGGRRRRRIPMAFPGSQAIEQWDANQFAYHCNVGRHRRKHKSRKSVSKEQFSWKRSANKIGNLYHTEMRSVVVFDHIAIVFKYFGKDQFIEMRCWDLIFNKRQRSRFVLDFECGRFEDLCVLQMGDGDIRVFDRRTRHHVALNAMEIMSANFRAKTEVRYRKLVRRFCASTELGEHAVKLVQNYLFALAPSFPCRCPGCTQ